MTVSALPRYPSLKARQALPASQLAGLNSKISTSLAQVLELPPAKRDTQSTCLFISTYCGDHAQQILHSLIWGSDGRARESKIERVVHQRVLLLAEKLAGSLDLQTLLDISVVYGPRNPKRTRQVLSASLGAPNILAEVVGEAVPAFTALLENPSQGLYGLRKISCVLLSFLQVAPVDIVRLFAGDKRFMLALAHAYDGGLGALSQSYGGIRIDRLAGSTSVDELDDWERIFLETKVALVDAFHVLLKTLLQDVRDVPVAGAALAARCEVAFEIVFALLEVRPSASAVTGGSTPFVDRPLLADYQHAYDLSHILVDTTRRAGDPRTELLEATLRAFDDTSDTPGSQVVPGSRSKPGVLKLLIHGSGIQPEIDNLGKGPSHPDPSGKGKGKATAPIVEEEKDDPALDAAVSQVLDILPDQPPVYLRFLLSHPDYPYRGSAERLIEALLEGTAPSLEEVEAAMGRADGGFVATEVEKPSTQDVLGSGDGFEFTNQRRNVFDDEQLDLAQLRVGKKTDDAAALLRDRTFIEQMKADILRRAEEVSDSEEEEEAVAIGDKGKGKAPAKGVDVAFEDDVDETGAVRVRDGNSSEDESEGSDEEEDEAQQPAPQSLETILELAYISDPKQFDRDGQTRRSKARADLKARTGWTDEQIEGWRIMLERNPKKDKILQKHEFAGNKPGAITAPAASSSQGQQGQGHAPSRGGARGGRGQGGGRGGARGRGRGGAAGGGGRDGGNARERAWKDKNKASRGNHNRKRGHDKKMARAGGPPES